MYEIAYFIKTYEILKIAIGLFSVCVYATRLRLPDTTHLL
jgi:hypothetical protein